MKKTLTFSETQSAEKSSDLLNGNAGPAAGWQQLNLPEDKGENFHLKYAQFSLGICPIIIHFVMPEEKGDFWAFFEPILKLSATVNPD